MAEEMVDVIGSTEGEIEYGYCDHNPHDRATNTGPGHQTGTAMRVHEHIVAQWVTDGHIAVIAHDSE
jgi:hypothetical protein